MNIIWMINVNNNFHQATVNNSQQKQQQQKKPSFVGFCMVLFILVNRFQTSYDKVNFLF